jgi:hypothetical protein
MKLILGIFFIMTTLLSCEYLDNRIIITNNNNEDIHYFLFNKDSLKNLYEEDTISNLFYYTNYIDSLSPQEKKNESRLGAKNEWEKIVLHGDSQKLFVFIFNIDTIKKYDWKTIVTNEKYQNRLSFSLKELQSSNWNIVIN